MTVTVTHSTPSDASFSASGASAWDANHTLSGVLPVANGGTNTTTSTGTGSVVLSDSPTFTTAITSTGALQLTGSSTVNQNIATSQLTGTLTIGGATATGAINIAPSDRTQTINIASGATNSTYTKIVNIGKNAIGSGRSIVDIGIVDIGTSHLTTISGNTLSLTGENLTLTATTLNIVNGGALNIGANLLQQNIFVGDLGTISGALGSRAFVTDAAAPRVGSIVVDGYGTGTPTPVYYDGTNWICDSGASGIVTSVSGTAPVVSSGGATPAISMAAATTSVSGYLTSTDWTTFNGKYSTGGALGTPSSGTVTNLTGTASININGTVGATTPTTGAFTTATANSFIPNSATVPTNGINLNGTNSLGFCTNSTVQFWIDSAGDMWNLTNATQTSSYLKFGDGTTAYATFSGYYDSVGNGHMELYALSATVNTEVARIYGAGLSIKSGAAPTAYVNIGAGTSTASTAPLKFTSGTNLTTAEAGAIEYDGNNFYLTADTSQGRNVTLAVQQFYLSAGVTAFGPASGDFFGATSSASLAAASTYDIECYCYFLKTTAGTGQWIPTFSSALTVGHSYLEYTPVTGFTTTVITGAMVVGEATQQTTTVLTHPATASLTTAVSHVAKLKIRVLTNLACNFRLKFVGSAGTITPQAGSFYTVRKVITQTGNFVA